MEMFWIFLAVVVVARSPVGRAIADRISGRAHPVAEREGLAELERRLEDRLLDLEERVDFTERLLQQQRGREGLPPLA